ncbi:TPA: hypothetical protein QDB40_003536 [Burkholderia vietnamiensis]|uniref:hypothetical protein n=1 Tax=Burkholderia cepacia TaxID=292 RepID=UPI0026535879|nr:hypothetical protein [Burkholderia cepacia]MDN7857972.1 hypothetical protein [Burkholderia cepacia]HDR9169539.1 hypothetical protein [Burkholderia vietnamiensis]
MEPVKNSLSRLTAAKPEHNLSAIADVAMTVAFQKPAAPDTSIFNLRIVDREGIDEPMVVCKATIGGRDAAATQVRIPHAMRDDMDECTDGPHTVVLVALAQAMLNQLRAEGKRLIVENK